LLIGLTCHFVNNEFESKSRLLALKFTPKRHTSVYLSNVITKVLQNWKLDTNIINATIDGASNINLAVELTSFLDKLRCITHAMNLGTKGILDKKSSVVRVFDIVKKCRNLVGTFKHSNFLSDQLKKAMELKRNASQDTDLPLVRTLKQDVMLKSVFEAHDSIITPVNSTSETKKKYSEMLLANSELEIVEDLVQLLLPFFLFTELMSGSNYVTILVVMPGVTRLLEILQLFESKFNNEFIEELSVNMHDDLERRTTEYFSNPLVICATYLDPRYRQFKFI
jgi:hypothetical protein